MQREYLNSDCLTGLTEGKFVLIVSFSYLCKESRLGLVNQTMSLQRKLFIYVGTYIICREESYLVG